MADKNSEETPAPATQYRATVGISFNGTRLEAGDVMNDLPEKSKKWLLKFGYVVEEEAK